MLIELLRCYYSVLLCNMARICHNKLSRMVGLRFPGGSFVFTGFGRRISTPSLTSLGYFPVLDVLFKSKAILPLIIFGPYLNCSATILSLPALLVNDLIALLTLSHVNGLFMYFGGTSENSVFILNLL